MKQHLRSAKCLRGTLALEVEAFAKSHAVPTGYDVLYRGEGRYMAAAERVFGDWQLGPGFAGMFVSRTRKINIGLAVPQAVRCALDMVASTKARGKRYRTSVTIDITAFELLLDHVYKRGDIERVSAFHTEFHLQSVDYGSRRDWVREYVERIITGRED